MIGRALAMMALVACRAAPTDAADTDQVSGDTDGADTDNAADTDDARDTDVADTDLGDTDAVPFQPDPTCDYLDLDLYVVWCGGVQSSMRRWAPSDGDPTCPVFFSVDGEGWLDASTALDQGGCDDTCVYRMHQAVMLVYCDVRGEYITWVPDGPGQDGSGATCDPLTEVHTIAGDAWVPDMDTYRASYPCP